MRKLILAALVVIVIIVEAPFLAYLAGDAQVHLTVAESFAQGRPFQFNPGDPQIMLSTSPFWMMMLTVLFHVFGYLTPLALKAVCVVCWASATLLLWKVVTEICQWPFGRRALFVGIWLSNTAIVANALGGLENVLSIAQLLLLYLGCVRGIHKPSWQRSLGMGLLLGWTILTRLDCGLFACVCVCSLFLTEFLTTTGSQRKQVLAHFVFVALVSGLFILPWYAYQYSATGSLLSFSALARLYGGRRTSWEILKGRLYFDPKAVFTLVTVFLPLTCGVVVALQRWGRGLLRSPFGQQLSLTYSTFAAASIVVTGILFYSFGVGADHFGRYFLPVFPFFFLLGFQGVWAWCDGVSAKYKRLSAWVLAVAMCYLILGSGVDYYRRVFLNVYYSPDLMRIVRAPQDRTRYTDQFLANLGVPTTNHIDIAVSEVQLRYYVDDRIHVSSLDGRGSGQILRYIDKYTGVPDFQGYLEETRPDFVQLGQWCEEGGWTASIGLRPFTPEFDV